MAHVVSGGRGPAAAGSSVARRIGRWPIYAAGPALAGWVAAIVALAGFLAVGSSFSTRARLQDVLTWLALTACAALCIEVMRRVGEPAGVAKDLLSAWTLPVALLLPPIYSLLIPIPLTALRQARIRRSPLHRRAYSAACVGLSNWAVAIAFHAYLRWNAAQPQGLLADRTAVLLVALGCAAVGCLVNVLLISVAVLMASPEVGWRPLLLDREQRVFDLGEICLGLVIAGCWFVTPALALIALVPVVLVQRSLSHTQLREAARTDAKTGLLNARAWQQEAQRELTRAHREGQPVALLIADLDHFKLFNDTYGHLAGDNALLTAVAALVGGLRPYDQLGRFGGEEFTAFLPRTGHAEAGRIAERLRGAVAAAPVVLGDSDVRVTVSIGVAVLGEHGDDLTDLLTAADHALYRAKKAGRNRIAIAADHVPSRRL